MATPQPEHPPRRYQRFAVRVPVYIESVDGSAMRKTITLESKDISAGGLSFETSKRVPLEAESRVVLSQLGDLHPGALIYGRVAHRERDPRTGRYSIGLEFTEFVNVSREDLLRRIEEWAGFSG